jgi:hypothetical protein
LCTPSCWHGYHRGVRLIFHLILIAVRISWHVSKLNECHPRLARLGRTRPHSLPVRRSFESKGTLMSSRCMPPPHSTPPNRAGIDRRRFVATQTKQACMCIALLACMQPAIVRPPPRRSFYDYAVQKNKGTTTSICTCHDKGLFGYSQNTWIGWDWKKLRRSLTYLGFKLIQSRSIHMD